MIDGLRLGAYVLAADPTWVRSSLARYYDHLDVLVVSAPVDGRGWTGAPVASEQVLAEVRALDTRGIVREVRGSWVDVADPLAGDTRQRAEALAAVGEDVDWVLQIDTDEVLPDPHALAAVLRVAQDEGLDVVEWPMRVLYRRVGHDFLQVTAADGTPFHEYPGPVAVRPGATLVNCRKSDQKFLRPVVRGDSASVQVHREPEEGEVRRVLLDPDQAIWHNSWARPPRSVRRKIASWGHHEGWRSRLYYWLYWLPAPLLWRAQRDVHPFDRDLWPRLARVQVPTADLLAEADR